MSATGWLRCSSTGLRQNMRLQSDPTILYGLFGGKVLWGRPIQRSEIGQKTAHNTYQIDGLPPTPICNPGRQSIEAVLQPRETRELYFVADGNGGHAFAESLKDHNANVQKWRLVEKDLKAKQAPEAPPEEQTAKTRPPVKQRAVVRTRPESKARRPSSGRPQGPKRRLAQAVAWLSRRRRRLRPGGASRGHWGAFLLRRSSAAKLCGVEVAGFGAGTGISKSLA